MDFAVSDRAVVLRERLRGFMEEHVVPRESELARAIDDEVRPGVAYPGAVVELRARAREAGLWNLWLANSHEGPGLTNVEYGVLCEEMGRSLYVAPAIFNCSFPDTGNAEALLDYGTPEQIERYARPLLDDDVRSCFALTEPEAASSDPTNIFTTARLEGDEWVLDGHKWWISGAMGAAFAIVMAVTEPDAPPHARCSAMPRATATASCASTACASPRTRCSAAEGKASRWPRRGSGPAASTTACARSARRSGPSSSCASARTPG